MISVEYRETNCYMNVPPGGETRFQQNDDRRKLANTLDGTIQHRTLGLGSTVRDIPNSIFTSKEN
jgi:hypothetical protein